MDQNLTIFLAPILIIGGGGLVAFGGLTLFGLDLVFKTRTQAILGICVGLVLLGVLEIQNAVAVRMTQSPAEVSHVSSTSTISAISQRRVVTPADEA